MRDHVLSSVFLMPPSPKGPVHPVTNPNADVVELLRHLVGDTGGIEDRLLGYRIEVYHTRAFPWDEVFKALLFRDYKVFVSRYKADLFIDAMPRAVCHEPPAAEKSGAARGR